MTPCWMRGRMNWTGRNGHRLPARTADQAPADDALASRLFAVHLEQPDSPAGRRAVFQALALSSAAHEKQVVSLLHSDDMWVQEHAVSVLSAGETVVRRQPLWTRLGARFGYT